jgi:hypothetical protein
VRAGASSTASEDLECEVAASYSIMKILASIFQLLAATYTLWLHRGDQVARWGFASFSFVPVPYAIMSLVNGISHLFTPDYPALYMVSSTVMQEAIDAEGSFCGIVGHVEAAQSQDSDTGYGSGFDSNWKGLTPGVLRRTALSLFNSVQDKQKLVKELTVSEEGLFGHAQSDNTNTDRAELPVLLVEQSPNLRGESYMVKSGLKSHNDIEGTAYKLPGVSLKWLWFGVAGVYILLGIVLFNLILHPKTTWHYIKIKASKLARILTPDDAASNVAVTPSFKRRLLTWLSPSSPSAEDIELDENLRQDRLPRISFRACERFQLRRDAFSYPSKFRTRGFAAQTFLAIVISGFSLLIMGLMSELRAGTSSRTEQIVLMMWLAVGIVIGSLVPFLNLNDAFTLLISVPLEFQAAANTWAFKWNIGIGGGVIEAGPIVIATIMLIVCIPWSIFVLPIWGFVIVGQQLGQWGTCVVIY